MRLLGLKVEWQRDRAKLRDILAEVASYGMDEWSVLLPALVVGKGENIPSGSTDEGEPGGFYAWCADNGIDISDPYKLVVNEQRKVYNFLTE